MENKTKSTRTQGFLSLFDMQTGFLERALEGISEEDALKRMDTKANHIAWIAGALVQQRFTMSSELYPEMKQKSAELFENNKGIQEDVAYPALAEYIADWKKITPMAREAIIEMDDAKLDSLFDMGFMKITYYELITFTMYREASMIGQLALWRRLLDYPAMRYD